MAELIIQEQSGRGKILQNHIVKGLPVLIGRGYENDIILADEYVCPRHLSIGRCKSGLYVENCNSKNGAYHKSRKRWVESTESISSGDILVLGKTHIKVLLPAHEVPEALIIEYRKTKRHGICTYGALFCIIVLFFFSLFWGSQLTTSQTNVTNAYFNAYKNFMTFLGFGFVWAGFWVLIGKIMKNQTCFANHLLMFIETMFLIQLVIVINSFTVYNLCRPELFDVFQKVSVLILFGILLGYSLNMSTRISKWGSRMLSCSLIIISISIVAIDEYVDEFAFKAYPDYKVILATPDF